MQLIGCVLCAHGALLTGEAGCMPSLALATVARPVLCRAKDALAEQAILLGLKGAAVDGFGPRDFAVTPRTNLLRRGYNKTKRGKKLIIEQRSHLLQALWALLDFASLSTCVNNRDIILKSARVKLPSWGAWDILKAT
jgi:hypothetical protein